MRTSTQTGPPLVSAPDTLTCARHQPLYAAVRAGEREAQKRKLLAVAAQFAAGDATASQLEAARLGVQAVVTALASAVDNKPCAALLTTSCVQLCCRPRRRSNAHTATKTPWGRLARTPFTGCGTMHALTLTS